MAWTNNFAYVGHRATGTGAGDFLLVAPDWQGEVGTDVTLIRCPTTIITIVGRWAVDGEDDLPAVLALQGEISLRPRGDAGRGIPSPDPRVPEELSFYEKLRVWMQAFPPAERDRAYQESFAPLGLFEQGELPYVDADPALAAALVVGLERGRANLEESLTNGQNPTQNGWDLTYHIFDYNLDFFEVGALRCILVADDV